MFCASVAAFLCILIAAGEAAEPVRIINAHAHLNVRARKGRISSADYERAAETVLASMRALAVDKTLLMPPPVEPASPRRGEEKDLGEIVKKYPDRFALLGGGGTLNPLIHESAASGKPASEVEKYFDALARGVVESGAVGFGEFAAEHLSFSRDHPYESARPDHPLFLRLADFAARSRLPIDLHMEAVARDMPVPSRLSSPNNPRALTSNLEAFERLLAHNRGAAIVWAHAGWDNTGDRTAALMRRLLETHPNLYMSIKIDRASLPETRPMAQQNIKPEWLDLLRSFADRFVIGSDEHFGTSEETGRGVQRSSAVRLFVDQLPRDLAVKIGYDNAVRIYRLR